MALSGHKMCRPYSKMLLVIVTTQLLPLQNMSKTRNKALDFPRRFIYVQATLSGSFLPVSFLIMWCSCRGKLVCILTSRLKSLNFFKVLKGQALSRQPVVYLLWRGDSCTYVRVLSWAALLKELCLEYW